MKQHIVLLVALTGYASAYQICNKPLDLVFVVEDTDCIPEVEVIRVKNFISQMAEAFTVFNDQNARIGLQLYDNTNSRTIFNLIDYTTTNDVQSAILRTAFTRPDVGPEIAQALNYTWSHMLTVTNGERSCQPTNVVLMSFCKYFDPNIMVGVSPAAPGDKDLDLYWARELRHSGAQLITIGVGPQRDSAQLIELAGNPANYFDFLAFSDLEDHIQMATTIANTTICNYLPNLGFLPCELETIALDVVFVVDTSTNLTPALKEDVRIFINNFLAPFTYGARGVQAALVTYNRVADPAILLNTASRLSDFLLALNNSLNSTQPGTERNVFRALDSVFNHIFIESSGYRAGSHVFKYVFLFSADCFTGDDPVDFANRLRSEKGAEIFPVQLSNSHKFWKELVDIAAHPRNLYEVQDAADAILQNYLHKQAWRTLCEIDGGYVTPLPYASTTAGTAPTTSSAAATTSTGPPG